MSTRSLVTFVLLAAAFVVYSVVVGLGGADATDLKVASTFSRDWNPGVGLAAKAVAMLGGVEITSLVVLGIAIHLWRRGFRTEVWFLLAFAAVEVMETVYKRLVFHPGPGPALAHGDGPSLTSLFETVNGNSFPSGHMTRAVFAYGLLAFVVRRLAPPTSRGRALAVPLAAVMILVMAVDRLYLEVHWESDVIGGILLGGLGLAAAVIWLDRPRGQAAA